MSWEKVQFHSSGCEGTVFWCTAPVMSINTPTKVYRSFGLWLCRLCWCQKTLYHLGWMRPCDKLPINWCGATGFQPQHLLHCSTQSHVMPQCYHCIPTTPYQHTGVNCQLHRVAWPRRFDGSGEGREPSRISTGVPWRWASSIGLGVTMSHEGWGAKAYCWWFLDSSAIWKAPYSSGIKLKSWWPDGWMTEERLNDGWDMLELWLYEGYRNTCFLNDGYFVFKWCQIAMFIEKSSNPKNELCFCSILLQHHQSWWSHESKGRFSRG